MRGLYSSVTLQKIQSFNTVTYPEIIPPGSSLCIAKNLITIPLVQSASSSFSLKSSQHPCAELKGEKMFSAK